MLQELDINDHDLDIFDHHEPVYRRERLRADDLTGRDLLASFFDLLLC